MLKLLLVSLFIIVTVSPPPPRNSVKDNREDDYDSSPQPYHPYLTKVIEILSSNPHGQAMLEKIQLDQIDLALNNFTNEFKFKAKEAYEQLNRLKFEELERIRHMINSKKDIPEDIHGHIDKDKTHFDDSDLIKLLRKAVEDIDSNRKKAFKNYEMEKHYNETKLKEHMSKEDVAVLEAKEAEKEAHLQEELKKNPIHEPGSKEQYEEIAHDVDQLDNFDPKTFFYLHDLDGNGEWDETEIAALVQNEVNKRFPNSNETDEEERDEFANQLEDDLLNDVDKNKDSLISYEEFMEDFKDELNNPQPSERHRESTTLYSQEEYDEMVKEREELFRKQHSIMNYEHLAANGSHNEQVNTQHQPENHLPPQQQQHDSVHDNLPNHI